VPVGNFITQLKQEEVLCEGLRVLCNLSRFPILLDNIIKLKLHEAVFLLLSHGSQEVVYYAVGVLINLTCQPQGK
jgi:hypothetical protein